MERAEARSVTEPSPKRGPATWSDTKRWAVASISLAICLMVVIWLVVTDAPVVRYLVRLYQDKHFLKETVRAWGVGAPLVFIAIQALQVIISGLRSSSSTPEWCAKKGRGLVARGLGGSSPRALGPPAAP